MLILMVLAMLTFFTLAGAVLLTLAMRSRTSARAFAAASRDAGSAMLARDMLDEALLVLVRGTKLANTPPAFAESLLEDKYGSSFVRFTGTASPTTCSITPIAPPIVSGSSQPILIANLTLVPSASPAPHPCELNGRMLTIKPAFGDGDIRSFRILRATTTGAAYDLYIDSSAPDRPLQLPKQPFDAHVSGREFTPVPSANSAPESYDAFDVSGNSWLAKPQLRAAGTAPDVGVSVDSVDPSYRAAASPSPATVDNDNDGVPDGIWLPPVDPSGTSLLRLLPDVPSPRGGVVKFQVSYLVLDLDGRLNVNTSGVATSSDWSAQPPSATRVAPGSGFGTADVDGSRLLSGSAADELVNAPIPIAQPASWRNLLRSGTPAAVTFDAAVGGTRLSPAQARLWPQVGSCDGRYGADGEPGTNGTSANQTAAKAAIATQRFRRLWGNSPSDLRSRMKLFMVGVQGVPSLTWFSPDMQTADAGSLLALMTSDLTSSPYDLRLDDTAARGEWVRRPTAGPGSTARPADNPFSLAELEPLLRIYDDDSPALAPRLAALLENFGQRSRMTITTDSWDTVAITGSAAAKVQTFMRSFPAPASPSPLLPALGSSTPYDLMAPEVAAGMKFDLNRPLEAVGMGYTPAQQAAISRGLKQQYCRDLFTLLVALGRPADKATAQWVANVCDFRDADSTMTRFVFDDNPRDGWTPVASAATTVFGMERPELVITETLVRDGNLSVAVHHPWKAEVTGTGGMRLEVETVADSLRPTATPTLNKVAVNRKVDDTRPESQSIWRLRLEGGVTASLGTPTDNPDCHLGPNEDLCIQTAGPPSPTIPRRLVIGSLVPPAGGATKLVLERLADPTAEPSIENPYVEVDSADVVVAPEGQPAEVQRRDATQFWRSRFTPVAGVSVGAYTGAAQWLHWPNRPFISSAELALVPSGNSRDVMRFYASPSPPNHLQPESLAVDQALFLFDAVHVPTWFAGHGVAVGGDDLLRQLATSGSYASNWLPSWREPGRLNVNTVLRSPVMPPAPEPAIAEGVWRTLMPTGTNSPFVAGDTSVASSFTQALSLATPAGQNKPYLDIPQPPRDRNPFFNHATAIRLAATTTIRSNVFAVWITLRMEDTSADAPAPTTHRMFAIIDRSIPVGYAKGENLDSAKVIRLKRFLD